MAELKLICHIPSHSKSLFRDFKAVLSSYPCAMSSSYASYPILWDFLLLRYPQVSLHVQAAPAGAPCWKPFWSGTFLRVTCISQPGRNSPSFFPQAVCCSSPHHSAAEYPLNDPVWQSWKQGKHGENEATAHRNNYDQLFMLNPHKALSHC